MREVQDALDAAAVPLEVRAGAELAQDDVAQLSDRQLDAFAHGPAGRRWVLIEAPLFADAGPSSSTPRPSCGRAASARCSGIPSAAPS